MKYFIFLFSLVSIASAQHTFSARVVDNKSGEPVPGTAVIIKNTNIGGVTDTDGSIFIEKIPDGTHTIIFSHIGFTTVERSFMFPLSTHDEIIIELEEAAEELEEVIVTTTRTSRSIEIAPTRIESLPLEEIEEKNTMRTHNVSMILHEATGIQMQQTSYASGNQSIRIQGLDGKYTQLLKDGYPAFGGFSSGLSVMDIPPLDLNQVEVIKGPSSTLYGGGAIAGVVNFVSKTPKEKPELTVMLNRTSAGGNDFGVFGAARNESYGATALATVHLQQYYDVNGDHFTELPKTNEFNFNPALFLYDDDVPVFKLSNATTYQDRQGGDIFVIEGKADSEHRYIEKNLSLRNNTYIQYEIEIETAGKLTAKQHIGFFNRTLPLADYYFKGNQQSSYSDISLVHVTAPHTLVAGINFSFEQFNEEKDSSAFRRNYIQRVFGLYAQDTWDITERFIAESGLRFDYSTTNEFFFLPRFSFLIKFDEQFSSRIGGGLGYKLPTMFSEDAEALSFNNVLPISATAKAERSIGGTFDMNYRNVFFGAFSISVNQMFFFTQINRPLVLHQDSLQQYFFNNASKPIRSLGFETNVKIIYDAAKLLLGYTYTNAKELYRTGNQTVPLLPPSRLNIIFIIEEERNYKTGFEAYFTDVHYLNSGVRTRSFWDMGLFLEKTFGPVSFFVNAENITDTRQSRFSQVVFPPHNDPTFEDVYTSHTEGFVLNGGVRIRF
jgi:outer membrane receptor for ferrienterochelin and colicins